MSSDYSIFVKCFIINSIKLSDFRIKKLQLFILNSRIIKLSAKYCCTTAAPNNEVYRSNGKLAYCS